MKTRLLVVDDSAFMRTAVRLMLKNDPEIEVVGEARTGHEAVALVETLNPGVVTMDVEMPGMDGLEATRIIMERFPRPIIMLSSMTERGADTTIRALALGAVDFISKKSSFVQLDIVQIGKELNEKITYWSKRYLQISSGLIKSNKSSWARSQSISFPGYQPELVLIAVSTGGPAIIPHLLRSMGQLVCPVVIAQHMPPRFTEGFARHLRDFSGLNVLQATEGMPLTPGMVAICPGATDTSIRESLQGKLVTSFKRNEIALIHPSADILFESASRLDRKVVAVIMTGMGSDGTSGARALAEKGSTILVQDPDECVVDGMPMSIISSGMANEVMRTEAIGKRLRKWAGAKQQQPRRD